MPLPTVFIVGVHKCATTSLYNLLAQHPEVFDSGVKEPTHYSKYGKFAKTSLELKRDFRSGEMHAVDRGRVRYETKSDYIKIYRNMGMGQVGVDASVNYFANLNAIRNISDEVPDAKIVIMLREPVARAFSAWAFHKSLGVEPSENMGIAVKEELCGLRDDWDAEWRYISMSQYADRVNQWRDAFSGRVFVASAEGLRAGPSELMSDLCRFLEIDEDFEFSFSQVSNVTKVPNSRILRALKEGVRNDWLGKRLVLGLLPHAFRDKLRWKVIELFNRAPSERFVMTDEEMEIIRSAIGHEGVTNWRMLLDYPRAV